MKYIQNTVENSNDHLDSYKIMKHIQNNVENSFVQLTYGICYSLRVILNNNKILVFG